jgi:transcription initiation factor TFIIIB Brf1 subunit/transcription initiation factor TFIIB
MMANSNEIDSPVAGASCPDCHANNIITTEYGTVCGECGCVIDELVFASGPSFGRDGPIWQSEPFRAHLPTKIGLPKEQMSAPEGIVRAAKYALDFESHVFQQAAAVIRDALARFGADTPAMFDACHGTFVKMYRTLPPRSPCRNVEVLSLAAIFRTAQVRRVTISCRTIRDMLVALDRPLATFRAVLQETAKLFPRTSPRVMVLVLAGQLASRLSLPESVTALVARIAREYGATFATRSKPTVAAAAVVAAAVLAKGLRTRYPMSYVAQAADVATSAVSRSIACACESLGSPLAQPVAVSGPALANLFTVPAAAEVVEVEDTKDGAEGAPAAVASPSEVLNQRLDQRLESPFVASLPLDLLQLNCGFLKASYKREAGDLVCAHCRGSPLWCPHLVDSLVLFSKYLVNRFYTSSLYAGPKFPPWTSFIDFAGFDPPPAPPV